MRKLSKEKEAPVRIAVLLPRAIVKKLEVLQSQGTTASGYIRHLIETDLAKKGKTT